MDYIEIEYNNNLVPLEKVLFEVKRPGDFYVHGAVETPMPKVVVKGGKTLSFPLPKARITELVRLADRAPYGRGKDTIVDTAVRNVWQLAAKDVRVSGESWDASFGSILAEAIAGLGCGSAGVSAELYKLLVYDKGGFFLAHRDTEKVSGMFGTLVVTLPSVYEGGELRIRHAGREVTIPTGTPNPSELSYCAFYADCEHEVLPVLKGNRVCLVYNLVQEQKAGKRAKRPKAPEYEGHTAEVAAILDRFLKEPDAPPKIAWLLEHQYSPAGLSFSALKGADFARARVLIEAAKRAGCEVHLAIAHVGESGAAEPEFDSYASRRNRYWYDDEDEEEAEESDNDYSVVDVCDSWKYLDEWRNAEDRVVKFGQIPLEDGELLPAGALYQEPPDEQRLTEATGNEGASFERSYHRAVIVLWRQDRTAQVLLAAGVSAALPYLKRLIAGGKRLRPQAIQVAESMVEAWPVERAGGWDRFPEGDGSPGPADRAGMIELLIQLDARPLLSRFLGGPVTSCYDGGENAALLASVPLLGNAKAGEILSRLVSARMPEHPNACAELLSVLSRSGAPCATRVAEAAVTALDGIRKPEVRTLGWRFPVERDDRHLPSTQFLVDLFVALFYIQGDRETFRLAAAEKIAARPEVFDPVKVVVPALKVIAGRRSNKGMGAEHLWRSASEFLLERSETPPEPPTDWRLDAKLSCSCPLCRELQKFANDPELRIHGFPLAKEKRRHLHDAINRAGLDMTHVTQRVGSPQTLVCTKDRRGFEARMKEYRREIDAMSSLAKLAAQFGGEESLRSRLGAAVERAG